MSQLLIHQYLNQIADLKKVSGSKRESVLREAFKDLLKAMGRTHELVFIPEYEIFSPTKERRYVDGALLHHLRTPFGYWEAKDEKDDLDAEILLKKKRGYPQDNIIFEDTISVVLIQNKIEIMRCKTENIDNLMVLLDHFFSYERQEIREFNRAVEQFKIDLPAILEALRNTIDDAYRNNNAFSQATDAFLSRTQKAINASISIDDIREMLIQHILTEDIFSKIFGDDDFHKHNTIAKELYKLEELFFVGNTKRSMLKSVQPYYAGINAAAAQIASHNEKQAFLKAIYENFYKIYNPMAADRLGVVYTPNEIVRFMIDGTDWLCKKNFNKTLISKDVDILDPAAGTGTFTCELLEHFRGQPAKLINKYNESLFANEIAVLPYYVANLNIEATFAAITSSYSEFQNLCLVDTLDNCAGLNSFSGHQPDLFGSISEGNVERITRQNQKRISIIIGNPPYNANQANENDNNKNRKYPTVDLRVKSTYIDRSRATKNKSYDPYLRFFRWASDRLSEDGIIAFITNRSFIDGRGHDGFRAAISEEFSQAWIIDLGGDVRANPKLSGTVHNVFGIQTGVAISFLVKRSNKLKGKEQCQIFYARRPEFEHAEEKLTFLDNNRLNSITFDEITPDETHNWINLTDSDFSTLLPMISKDMKGPDSIAQTDTIFKYYTTGVSTNRDEWVIDHDEIQLKQKMTFFVKKYNEELASLPINIKSLEDLNKIALSNQIKWSEALKNKLIARTKGKYSVKYINELHYRPFVLQFYYTDKQFSDRLTKHHYEQFGENLNTSNTIIAFSGLTSKKPFQALASKHLMSLDCLEKTQTVPRYVVDSEGGFVDNITDKALSIFKNRYKDECKKLTKDDIFAYVYAILNDPKYRIEYAIELTREFPQIPFYKNFKQWVKWGNELIDLHTNFQNRSPIKFKRVDVVDKESRARGVLPKIVLKSLPDRGIIILDGESQLQNIDKDAWAFKFGNRTAIDWVLDQYKPSKSTDENISERFNNYSYYTHKENIIDLILRVASVSVGTKQVVDAMLGSPER